jgi:hypothetical protein
MGQYHVLVSLTANEYIDSNDYDCGVKFQEIAWSTGRVIEALGNKLQSDWRGHRIALVGDYYHKGDLPEEAFTGLSGEPQKDFYSYVFNNFDKSLASSYVNDSDENHVIMNYSKNEYITPEGYGDETNPNIFSRYGSEGGVMEVLLALIAASCKGGARGGGDIESDNEFIGSWAGDSIAIIPSSQVSSTALCIDSAMRQIMVDSGETTYADIEGKIVRSSWDYSKNRHGVLTV